MATIRETEIKQVMYAVDVLSNIEAQDRTLVLEMSQTMLRDIIDNGTLEPMGNYSNFISCTDTSGETDALILSMIEPAAHVCIEQPCSKCGQDDNA
jgi:hypothetical protein